MKNNKKILVCGGSGLLGTSLVPYLNQFEFHTISVGKTAGLYSIDLLNELESFSLLDQISPNLIINLVALTDVDLCEKDPALAFRSNVLSVETLTKWIQTQKKEISLIQISTDQLYDGQGPHPEKNVKLQNTYAYTKYFSEIVALKVNATILRTNFFGKSANPHRKSFSDWIVENYQNKKEFSLFTDVLFSPLSLITLLELLKKVVLNPIPGVFNLGSTDGFSKAEFGLYLAQKLGFSSDQVALRSVTEFGLPAYRPKDMRMDSSFFEKIFQVSLPSLREEIDKTALKEYTIQEKEKYALQENISNQQKENWV